MAAESPNPKKPPEAADQSKPTAQDGVAKGAWRRFLTGKWIAAIVVASLVVHGLGFMYYRVLAKTPAPAAPATEIPLGVFHFSESRAESGRVSAAEFSLYVTLLDYRDRAAREALFQRRYRVQQDVEQLLRQAHSGDFNDATLSELKRQLREQINESLGVRAIADVLITNLKLQYSATAGQSLLSAADPKAATD